MTVHLFRVTGGTLTRPLYQLLADAPLSVAQETMARDAFQLAGGDPEAPPPRVVCLGTFDKPDPEFYQDEFKAWVDVTIRRDEQSA